MVLSVVFSSVSFLVFLGQLFTMSKGGLFYFTGLCQVFAGNSGVKQCAVDIFRDWALYILSTAEVENCTYRVQELVGGEKADRQ